MGFNIEEQVNEILSVSSDRESHQSIADREALISSIKLHIALLANVASNRCNCVQQNPGHEDVCDSAFNYQVYNLKQRISNGYYEKYLELDKEFMYLKNLLQEKEYGLEFGKPFSKMIRNEGFTRCIYNFYSIPTSQFGDALLKCIKDEYDYLTDEVEQVLRGRYETGLEKDILKKNGQEFDQEKVKKRIKRFEELYYTSEGGYLMHDLREKQKELNDTLKAQNSALTSSELEGVLSSKLNGFDTLYLKKLNH